MTEPRVVSLALFGVSTGFDPGLDAVAAVVRDAGRERAQQVLDRAGRLAGRRAGRLDRWTGRLVGLRQRADDAGTKVVLDPDGAAVPIERLAADHDRDAVEVGVAAERGDRRHRRSSRGARMLAAMLPWLDAVLFVYFIAGVTNADPTAPWTTPVASLVTLGLALLAVLAVAGFTPWLGRHLRFHKTADGDLAWADLGPIAIGLVLLWALLLAALATTMVVRVLAEASAEGADAVIGGVVAALLALATIALNAFVLLVAFADGTVVTDGLVRRGRVVRRAAARRAALRCRWTALGRRALRLLRRDRRSRVMALGRATRILERHEAMLRGAALRAGVATVPGTAGAVEQLDLTPLDDRV